MADRKEKRARIRNIKDKTANWEKANPVLLDGEIGIEIKPDGSIAIKIGDGKTAWKLLKYVTKTMSEADAENQYLQDQINNIVVASSADGGDVSAEVAQARVDADGTNYLTLKERLDAEQAVLLGLNEDLNYLKLSALKTDTSINLLPLSTNSDGTEYVGTNGENGYKSGYRIRTSTGEEAVASNVRCTGFMPITYDDVLRIKNVTIHSTADYNAIVFYASDFTYITGNNFASTMTESDGVYSCKPSVLQGATDNIAYMRISCGDITDDTIITVNEFEAGIDSIKNDIEQMKEEKTNFLSKNQGTENVGKILVVGADGNLTLTDMPEGGASGDITGYLDANNNIRLSGNLADGTYTLKYENEDGTFTEIGMLEVGATSEPEIINLFAVNGEGYIATPGRCSSTGANRTDSATTFVTNYIDVSNGDTVYVKGCNVASNTYDTGQAYSGIQFNDDSTAGFFPIDSSYTKDYAKTNGVTQFAINAENAKRIRLTCINTTAMSDIIITVNQPLS